MKLSIITATKNCAATVADCMTSIIRQTHPDIEQVIIDGASTDATLEIVTRVTNPDSPSTKIVSEPDRGIYDAMNKGIALATGDVIGILNADDMYADEQVLERVAEVFRDENVDACYGDLVYVKECERLTVKGEKSVPPQDLTVSPFTLHPSPLTMFRYWKAGEFTPRKFYWGWMPPHPTFFVRRQVYERYGVFSLEIGSAADYELMLRFLLKHRIAVAYIPHILVRMRVGGMSNASLANRVRANRMDRDAWRVNDLRPYPWTIMMKPMRKIPQFFSSP
jgi:glycosyltransferase involved in cell wall biosynthesis